MNNVRKYVVSTTLESADWNNSTLINGNVVDEITKLKQQPGKDITILGSATLINSLLKDDLIDKLQLLVHPVIVGKGKRLFHEGNSNQPLVLVESKALAAGVLSLTYKRAGE